MDASGVVDSDYTKSQHNNPLCRVVPIEENVVQTTEPLLEYDKEK
jgi:hypothetical protein